MARAKLRFTENEVRRAIRAATKAGLQIGRVVVETTGDIVVVAARGDAAFATVAQSGQPTDGGAP
jgi:hypothetical protein